MSDISNFDLKPCYITYHGETVENPLAQAHQGCVFLTRQLIEGRWDHRMITITPTFRAGHAHHALVSCIHETCIHFSPIDLIVKTVYYFQI